MRSLGQHPTDTDLTDMIKDVDIDGSHTIDFSEFLYMMAKKMRDTDSEEELRSAFKVFDKDNLGEIDTDQMRSILRLSKMSEEEIEELVRVADRECRGVVQYDVTFRQWCPSTEKYWETVARQYHRHNRSNFRYRNAKSTRKQQLQKENQHTDSNEDTSKRSKRVRQTRIVVQGILARFLGLNQSIRGKSKPSQAHTQVEMVSMMSGEPDSSSSLASPFTQTHSNVPRSASLCATSSAMTVAVTTATPSLAQVHKDDSSINQPDPAKQLQYDKELHYQTASMKHHPNTAPILASASVLSVQGDPASYNRRCSLSGSGVNWGLGEEKTPPIVSRSTSKPKIASVIREESRGSLTVGLYEGVEGGVGARGDRLSLPRSNELRHSSASISPTSRRYTDSRLSKTGRMRTLQKQNTMLVAPTEFEEIHSQDTSRRHLQTRHHQQFQQSHQFQDFSDIVNYVVQSYSRQSVAQASVSDETKQQKLPRVCTTNNVTGN
ncbi:uncharacterized protein LOC134841167 isoform X1 [Symsagittifera roscoffensis]|uniref:uncharacterized protein LOC134841167 isoform X1 n=1 Tax=Symsagittifera roscoffensis TaxID=84072 RepID=UPI00307C240B